MSQTGTVAGFGALNLWMQSRDPSPPFHCPHPSPGLNLNEKKLTGLKGKETICLKQSYLHVIKMCLQSTPFKIYFDHFY